MTQSLYRGQMMMFDQKNFDPYQELIMTKTRVNLLEQNQNQLVLSIQQQNKTLEALLNSITELQLQVIELERARRNSSNG